MVSFTHDSRAVMMYYDELRACRGANSKNSDRERRRQMGSGCGCAENEAGLSSIRRRALGSRIGKSRRRGR
jgi:hypothetical protein